MFFRFDRARAIHGSLQRKPQDIDINLLLSMWTTAIVNVDNSTLLSIDIILFA